MNDPRPVLSVQDSSAFLIVTADAKFVAEASSGWRESGLTVRIVRGRKMRTVETMFDEMAAALQFPSYFGENWPAFYECLPDMNWLPMTVGIVILIHDAAEVLADVAEVELATLVRSIETASSAYSEPIDLGEWWDRAAVPFHVVLHSTPADTAVIRARWQAAGAKIQDFPQLEVTGHQWWRTAVRAVC